VVGQAHRMNLLLEDAEANQTGSGNGSSHRADRLYTEATHTEGLSDQGVSENKGGPTKAEDQTETEDQHETKDSSETTNGKSLRITNASVQISKEFDHQTNGSPSTDRHRRPRALRTLPMPSKTRALRTTSRRRTFLVAQRVRTG